MISLGIMSPLKAYARYATVYQQFCQIMCFQEPLHNHYIQPLHSLTATEVANSISHLAKSKIITISC